ncbi:MAG: hypothetical protein ACI9KN_001561 [Gammaproteobacteria bacterium]|jgi:hypothetical protein
MTSTIRAQGALPLIVSGTPILLSFGALQGFIIATNFQQ